MNKIYLRLLLLALVLTLVMPGAAGQVLADSAAPQVQVESVDGVAGSSTPVRIQLLNPGDIMGGSFDLHYDPAIVEPVLVGDSVKVDPGTLCDYVQAQLSPGVTGVISIAAIGSATSAAQTVSLCTVYFKLLKTGESALTLSELELSDGFNNLTNTSVEVFGGKITVGDASAPIITAASSQTAYPNSTATRSVTVNFAGQVSAATLPAATIQLQILDLQVPASVVASISDLALDAEGKFSGEWIIPENVAVGSYTLQAIYTGQTYPNLGTFSIITLEAPVAAPGSQQFTVSQEVILTCATEGSAIYYTLDPLAELGPNDSQLYSAPIQLNSTTTIKAVAIKDGAVSETVEFTYTLVSDDCFIATASYGSKFAPAVKLLRAFRDSYLLTNAPGRAFVAFYYHNSPPIARYIAGSEMLRAAVRALLTPLVAGVYLLFHPGFLIGLISIMLAGFLWRRRQIGREKQTCAGIN